jgi:hypothetical protein
VGAMISGGWGGEFATAFLVGIGEVFLEGSQGPGGLVSCSPAFDASGKDAGLLE